MYYSVGQAECDWMKNAREEGRSKRSWMVSLITISVVGARAIVA
jgi:hypothetical protein